jgi:FkbM family methyltransferase
MLTEALIATAQGLAPEVGRWPRRVPGRLLVDGKVIKYADLHSFYHQTRQIFAEHIYDFSCPEAAPTILDCGAHIGLSSLFFKQRFPHARIRAFEADAAIAALCTDNLRACGYTDVEVNAAAVWTHAEGVSFSASQDDAGHVTGDGQTKVPSKRLKDIIGAGPIQLLKLDVEGAEFAVLADCGEALRHVERMIVEVHAFDRTAQVGAILKLLEDTGFRYSIADLHHATWMTTAERPPFAAISTDKYYFSVFAWR